MIITLTTCSVAPSGWRWAAAGMMTSWMVSMFSCPLTWRVVTWLVHWLLSENYKVTRATTQASPSGNRLILGVIHIPSGATDVCYCPRGTGTIFSWGGGKNVDMPSDYQNWGGTGISIPLRQKVGGGGQLPPLPPRLPRPCIALTNISISVIYWNCSKGLYKFLSKNVVL